MYWTSRFSSTQLKVRRGLEPRQVYTVRRTSYRMLALCRPSHWLEASLSICLITSSGAGPLGLWTGYFSMDLSLSRCDRTGQSGCLSTARERLRCLATRYGDPVGFAQELPVSAINRSDDNINRCGVPQWTLFVLIEVWMLSSQTDSHPHCGYLRDLHNF